MKICVSREKMSLRKKKTDGAYSFGNIVPQLITNQDV